MADYSKLDHFSLKAQKEGYPARSVYKLKEMDGKFGLLKAGKAYRVLDLGAAPGSWSLYLLQKKAIVTAVDLSPLSGTFNQGLPDKGQFCFLQGDFTDGEIREAIISKGPYDLIVSDAAPATAGNRLLDTQRSLELAEAVVDYAAACLVKGGSLVVKVFQGGDTGNLLKTLRGLFKTGRSFKPGSSRAESFETYYLGLEKITKIKQGEKNEN